jgi:arylsulfatase A-like enzyme
VKGYSTDNYTEWATDFIRGEHRDAGKPWYLWLCYGAVHGPYTPAQRHKAAYPGVEVPIPADIYPPRPGKPAHMQTLETWVKGESGQPVPKAREGARNEKTLHDWVRQYNQGVLGIDEGVGRLMAVLKETDQLKNTLVVYTSDQGFAWGQHGFRHKLAPYDANIRAPFIVSFPGVVPEGTVCETPVAGADLVPTFFRFAGIELPWTMHGHDLTPLLKDPKHEWPHPVLTILTGDRYGSDTAQPATAKPFNGLPWWVSLRQGRHKYIRTLVADEIEELYDLQADPEELTNLALETKYAERLATFREATVAELRRTGAAMADNLPPVRDASR